MKVKEALLNILEQNRGKSCSGEELASQLGVTRAAVWKAVKALEEDGYRIISQKAKGYTLAADCDTLSEPEIRAAMEEKYKDIRIVSLETVDSTNNYAKAMIARGETDAAIVSAAEQTSGRGRRGKSFFSPAGKGVYFSIIIPVDKPMDASVMLTAAAAVAVARAVERISGGQAQIKWVNDVFCGGKKVCGILSEAVCDMESGRIETIVVGIGVNLSAAPEDFPEEIRGVAGSVFPKNVRRSEVIALIASELLALSEDLSSPELIEDYKSRMLVLGRRVGYVKNGVRYSGIAEDITPECALVVRHDDNSVATLSSGEISLGSAEYTG